jgi:hypothetical protein
MSVSQVLIAGHLSSEGILPVHIGIPDPCDRNQRDGLCSAA